MVAVDLSDSFVDDSGQELTFSLVGGLPLRSGLSLNAAGMLSGTPLALDLAAVQPLRLRLMATDPWSANTTANVTITVFNNTLPVLILPFNTTVVLVGRPAALPLQPHWSDGDGHRLTFTVSGLPNGTGLMVDSSGVLVGVPTLADALVEQPLSVRIIAFDGYDEVSAPLTLEVINNHAPVSDTESLSEVTGEVGLALVVDTAESFSDVDGDKLRYVFAKNLSASITLDPATGVVRPPIMNSQSHFLQFCPCSFHAGPFPPSLMSYSSATTLSVCSIPTNSVLIGVRDARGCRCTALPVELCDHRFRPVGSDGQRDAEDYSARPEPAPHREQSAQSHRHLGRGI